MNRVIENYQLEDYRFEKKYIIDNLSFEALRRIISDSSLQFKEIYQERQINNIYFDTYGFNSYYDNINGISDRTKYRIRWYGIDFFMAKSPTLELKIKKGLLNTKMSFNCLDKEFNNPIDRSDIKQWLLSSGYPESLKYQLRGLNPVLVNTYRRNYFLSSNHKIRLTIDRNLHAQPFINNRLAIHQHQLASINLVLEAKYAPKDEIYARTLSMELPFRLSKNSKFVNGLSQIF
jgi:SPX domain protein involved in polyphosphate accumulation